MCVSQTVVICRILLCMSIDKLTKRLSNLCLLLFPVFATTESRLSPQTDDSASSLDQTKRYDLTPLCKDDFSH